MYENDIFDAIKSRNAKMRPRWYFVLQMILEIATALVLTGCLLFIANFILFILHENGGLFAVNFGIAGWYVFFRSLPWTLLLIEFLLVLILAMLLRRYSFVYQRPLLYLLVGIIAVMAIASFVLTATSFSSGFINYAQTDIPVIQNVYQFESTLPNDIHRGEIERFLPDGFLLYEISGRTSTILFGERVATSVLETLEKGDYVLIFGSRSATGTVQALGIEQVQ